MNFRIRGDSTGRLDRWTGPGGWRSAMAIWVAIVGFLGPSVTRAISQTTSSVFMDGSSHLEMGGLGLSAWYTIEGWVGPTAHDNNHRLVDLGLGQAG
ncbi:MAG: hypothetical protein ACKOEQ_04330 [Verrucomicrobiota bacterium]